MREKIQEQLRRIEEAENIKILLAVESGSRAWGFASPDSDYDVRFIYIRRLEDYLRLGAIRDVIELPIDDVLDIKLNALVGKYVNLEYTLPNGEKVKNRYLSLTCMHKVIYYKQVYSKLIYSIGDFICQVVQK